MLLTATGQDQHRNSTVTIRKSFHFTVKPAFMRIPTEKRQRVKYNLSGNM